MVEIWDKIRDLGIKLGFNKVHASHPVESHSHSHTNHSRKDLKENQVKYSH